MIDIHSHVLPGVDDGSRSREQSADVLRAMYEAGLTALVLTPHVKASETRSDLDDPIERRAMAYEWMMEVVEEAPALYQGFEIMLDQAIPESVARSRVLSLAESRYHLVEFPLHMDDGAVIERLSALVAADTIPIVAHPERYLVCSVDTVAGWRRLGARCQVDATTLTRATTRGFRARELLGAGLIDVMAADNHGDGRSIQTGVDYLRARGAGDAAELLADVNPAAILQDDVMEPAPSVVLKETLLEKIKRRVHR